MVIRILLAGALLAARGSAQDQGSYEQMMLFSNILNHIQSNYVKEKHSSDLVLAAIRGVMTDLDPFTNYLGPERFTRMNDIMQGKEFGVGVELEIINGEPTVISVIQGSPASKTRIRRGDVLVAVGDSSIAGLKDQDLRLRLHDHADTKVKMRFRRAFTMQEYAVTVRRARYPTTTLGDYFLSDSGVGYLKLRFFGLESAKEVERALGDLRKQGMTRLIFDLRGNPGGSVGSAIGIADLFIPKDSLLLETTGRKDDMKRKVTASDRRKEKLPVAVLIDRGSASASELVAGILQDYDRAVLVGTNSFGKAYIQGTFLLSNGGALMMTIGKYKLPSGRTLQRNYLAKKASDLHQEIYWSDSNWIRVQPEFRTSHGRPVHGDIGLIPDRFMEGDDSLAAFVECIIEQNVLPRYAARFCNSRSVELTTYKKPADFQNSFSPTATDVDSFVAFLKVEECGELPTSLDKANVYKGLLRAAVLDYWFRQTTARFYLLSLDGQYREAIRSLSQADDFARRLW